MASDGWTPNPEMLSKIEVKHMLSQKFVDWEHLHTDILVTIYKNRATSKSVAGKRTAQMTDARFKLFHDLSRQLPTFLSNASEGKVEQWVSGVYSLAIDFARLLDDRLIKGGRIFWKKPSQFSRGTGLLNRGSMSKQYTNSRDTY